MQEDRGQVAFKFGDNLVYRPVLVEIILLALVSDASRTDEFEGINERGGNQVCAGDTELPEVMLRNEVLFFARHLPFQGASVPRASRVAVR